jgi:GNAT superfamily N-acetyltransferase
MHSKTEGIMEVTISISDLISEDEVIDIYKANKWSSADKPKKLLAALNNSHILVTARISGRLIGIANAISDGHLVVYYPHMLVHPDYQRKGIGRKLMETMQTVYSDFHQQMLTADGEAVKFYQALGFERAGKTEPMWIYSGEEH